VGYLEARDQAGAREAARAHLRYLRGHYEHLDRDRARGSNVDLSSHRTESSGDGAS
jgi:GntR family transcriptional regulator, transcriptional repressor for pyruvate dehydrogenase complex